MRLGKLFVTDTELAYGQETQGRDKQLLSQIGSIEGRAFFHGGVGTCLVLKFSLNDLEMIFPGCIDFCLDA